MGYREILMMAAVAAICAASLWRSQIALYGYLWYALMRPDVLAFVEAKYPISLVLAVMVLISVLREAGAIPAIFQSSISRSLLLLQIPLGLSVVFAVNPDLCSVRYNFYVRMIVVLFAIPVLIRTEQHLRELLLVMTFSLGAIAVKFGAFGLIHGGAELISGYGNMDDNNFLALSLAMLVPLCWYYLGLTSSRVIKLGLLGIMLCAVAQIVMSGSRGSSLALGLGLLMVVARSKRRIGVLLAALVLIGPVVYLVRDMYFARMTTLRSYDEEASAASRIVHAKAAFAMWRDYPILGVGFGGMNYARLSSQYADLDGEHVAHNTYLQTLVDSGIIAFVLYVYVLLMSVYKLGHSAAYWKERNPARAAIAWSFQTALVSFLLGCTFYSCQRMDFPYMLLMGAGAWENMDRQLRVEDEAAAPELAETVA